MQFVLGKQETLWCLVPVTSAETSFPVHLWQVDSHKLPLVGQWLFRTGVISVSVLHSSLHFVSKQQDSVIFSCISSLIWFLVAYF